MFGRMISFALGLIAVVLVASVGSAMANALPNAELDTFPDTFPVGAPLQVPTYTSSEAPGLPEQRLACAAEPGAHLGNRHSSKSPICLNLSKDVSADGSSKHESRSPADSRSAPISPAVTNEAGDILEVEITRPGVVNKNSEGSLFTTCALAIPYIGSSYAACGYVFAYDAAKKSSKEIPMTNSSEHAEYDACGTKVNSGTGSGWHIIGKEYWNAPSWTLSGTVPTIPTTEPVKCLGTWTMLYKFTQTFSDGETLTDSIEMPFLVTLVPIPPSATWGGGNPSELSCSQLCGGDPVNTATGDHFESSTDLAISGRGPGLELTRTYSSLAAKAGESSVLGRGWAFSYGMRLSEELGSGKVTVINANGSKTQFDPGAFGYVAPHEYSRNWSKTATAPTPTRLRSGRYIRSAPPGS